MSQKQGKYAMNTLNIYAVLDVKAQIYSQPHFMQTNGVAIRSFATACEDTNTQFNKYPEDYSLYEIGNYNVETAELSKTTPKQIANASEFVQTVPLEQSNLI